MELKPAACVPPLKEEQKSVAKAIRAPSLPVVTATTTNTTCAQFLSVRHALLVAVLVVHLGTTMMVQIVWLAAQTALVVLQTRFAQLVRSHSL